MTPDAGCPSGLQRGTCNWQLSLMPLANASFQVSPPWERSEHGGRSRRRRTSEHPQANSRSGATVCAAEQLADRRGVGGPGAHHEN